MGLEKFLEHYKTTDSKKVPNAPFKKNWHELAMKRIIKYAIDNDFEAISFTPGSVQVERYDLSKQINSLNAEKIKGGSMDGKYNIDVYHGDEGQINKILSEDELEEFIGKDLAKKIVDDAPNFPDGKEYSGLDLKVGGEGMIGFYDKMLPSFINKFVKKYKTKLTEGSIKDLKNTNEYYNVPFLEITPEMKMDIYEKGVPIAKVKKKKVNQQSTRMA